MLTKQQILTGIDSLEKQGASQEEIQEWITKQTVSSIPALTTDKEKKDAHYIGNFLVGAGKGLLSTVTGLGQLALKGASVLPLPEEAKKAIQGGIQTGEELKNKELAPENTSQTIGKATEQIGEFFIPVGGEARALSFLEKILPKSGKLSALGAKVIGSSAEFTGKTALQTGGDTKQMTASGVIGAVAPVVGAGVGAVRKQITQVLPERIYSVIFKTAKDDLMQAYKTISKGETLNPTLAQEVLDRGIKGSSQNMAVYSLQKLDQLENQVQKTVKTLSSEGKTIALSDKEGYLNILKTIKTQFNKTLNTGRSKTAQKLADEISSVSGDNIPVDLGLRLRRFIDTMRNTSSFRLNPNLAGEQEGFKTATNELRKELANIGMKDLMNEERIYISALDDIVDDAVKRHNKNILGLFDLIAGGGGMAAGNIAGGLTMGVAVRAFQQPFTLTNLAQALYKLRKTPSMEGLFKVVPPVLNQKTTK